MPSIENKKKTQQNKLLYIFLSAFFVSLVVIIYLATAFTPEIDVDVNSKNEYAESRDADVDDSLRELQQEERIKVQGEEAESSSDLVEQLKKLKEEALSRQEKQDEAELEKVQYEQAPETPKLEPANPSYNRQGASSVKMAKVYVGRYSTFDEAIKVQDALVQSSLVSSPFIKNMGTYYVIQAGSFANQNTAQNIAENLIQNGYSARMVLE